MKATDGLVEQLYNLALFVLKGRASREGVIRFLSRKRLAERVGRSIFLT